MKKLLKQVLLALVLLLGIAPARAAQPVVFAFFHLNHSKMPDPTLMTHIVFYCAWPTDDLKHMKLIYPERLRQVVALKKKNPKLKVMLSICTEKWKFHEIAKSRTLRNTFANNLKKMSQQYGLDGFDINWEFPTIGLKGLKDEWPEDKANFAKLMKQLRTALGKDKVLTFDCEHHGNFFDFKAVLPYVDYVIDMCYEFNVPPKHQSALYPSERARDCAQVSLNQVMAAGVPKSKLLFGFPCFVKHARTYDRQLASFIDHRRITGNYHVVWDDVAKVPYVADRNGTLVLSYENEWSVTLKCRYAKQLGLPGVMYFEYGDDYGNNERLVKAVAREMLGR